MILKCPTQNRLQDFLEGSIADRESEEISTHISECLRCDEALSDLENNQSDVLKLLRANAPTGFLLEPEFAELRKNTVGIGIADTDSLSDEHEPLESGKRLRDYRLVRKIGEGGMGTVYQAVHVHLAKSVALKILPTDKLQSGQSVSRFRQEMRAVGRVNHPNVVSASDAGKIDGQHFLVMELVQGADLARIIQECGQLGVADACEIVRQAANGLQHAHDNGLVHRDVKPSNVMLAVDGSVKLLDLGLASLNKTDFEASANITVSDGLTSVGQIMGTLDYMAPEQITASPDVDVRADVYALGATLFQLLTRKTPCGDRSHEMPQRIEAVLSEPPLDIATLRNDVPEELRALLTKMLAKSPSERPQAASEVAREIARFTSDAKLATLAETCRTSLDIPSADVDVTDDASFLVSRIVEPEKRATKRRPLTARAILGTCLTLFAAAVFFIVTNNGTVKVEVLDESFQVAIDGRTLTVTEEGNAQPIKLRVGEHKLTVKIGNSDFVTSDFEIRRNGEVAFRVEPLSGKVIVSRDGREVASTPMPATFPPANPNSGPDIPLLAESSTEAARKTLADLPASDLAIIYRIMTGAELGGGFASDKPSPAFARDVNILLTLDTVSREKTAKKLVDIGKPELAKIVLSNGRVDPSAAEAMKLGDLLLASGNGDKAVDAYLEAYRIAPLLFDSENIETFEEHGRLKDLAELFSEERIHATSSGSVSPMHFLLKRLMKDDVRPSLGMPFMARAWKGRPGLRSWILDEVPWNEVPDRAEYFAQVLIPDDVEKVGKGWKHLFAESSSYGGWLNELRNIMDEQAARQLIAKVRPLVEEHPNWIAGSAILVTLEAIAGDYESAKQWIKENHETVVGSTQEHGHDELLAYYAGFLGVVLEGRDRELDRQVIKLYEESLEHRHARKPYRDSRLHELVRLYHKFGRDEDALGLLYGLVEREIGVEEYLVENFFNPKAVNLDHERIWDIRTAVETLNRIHHPMDSLSLLSQIDFEQRRRAGVNNGQGWLYNDEDVDKCTQDSRKLVTPNAIVEAMNRGVLPLGLASTINKESGDLRNPIVDLLGQVARGDLSDEVTAAFESVNPKLSDAEALDQHLNDLIKQRPNDTDVDAAAAIFAFLRDDIDPAKQRLQILLSVADAKQSFRAADINLYVVAEFAVKHPETVELGRRLAARAIKASEHMTDEWSDFFAIASRTPEFSAYDGEGLAPFQLEKLVRTLLKDEATRDRGNHILKQLWSKDHDRQYNLLTFNAQEIWPFVDDTQFFLRSKLIPANIAAEGSGWGRFRLEGSYELSEEPGWGYPLSLKPLLHDREALQALVSEVEAGLRKNNRWTAGTAVLAYLETGLGNYERATELLQAVLTEAESRPMPSDAAFIFGMAMEGHDAALDREVMRLYELSLQNRPARPFRVSAIPKLGRLYAKYGQPSKARQTLHRLSNPDYDPMGSGVYCSPAHRPGNRGRCTECHSGKSNLVDYVVMAENLTNIGYPVDSYVALHHIDASFNNAYGSSDGWARATMPPDFYPERNSMRLDFVRARTKAAEALTPQTALEALKSGVFSGRDMSRPTTVGLGSIDLQLSVRGLNAEQSELVSPVIEVLWIACQFGRSEAMEKEFERLDDLLRLQSEVHSSDVQAAVASTMIAFVRNDMKDAGERMKRLEELELSTKPEDQLDNTSLWLVARHAVQRDSTRNSGERLAAKALAAARQLADSTVKNAMIREQSEWDTGHVAE